MCNEQNISGFVTRVGEVLFLISFCIVQIFVVFKTVLLSSDFRFGKSFFIGSMISDKKYFSSYDAIKPSRDGHFRIPNPEGPNP